MYSIYKKTIPLFEDLWTTCKVHHKAIDETSVSSEEYKLYN